MDKCGNCMRLSECTYEFGAKADDPSCAGFLEPLRSPHPEGPTMTDKTVLEVTQRAREYAADAVKAYRDNKNNDWQGRIRRGECDDGEMVQAFARFKRDILATRAPDPTPAVPADGLVEALERIAAPAIVPLDQCPDADQPNGWRVLAIDRIDIARAALAAYRGEA